jgi:hypothetical protein
MHPEAAAAGDHVFVDDTQCAETHVAGIMVVREREGVFGLKPSVVGVAAVLGSADLYHINLSRRFVVSISASHSLRNPCHQHDPHKSLSQRHLQTPQ